MADRAVRVLAGLGNPGPEYDATRHNVGFAVLDEVAARLRASFRPRGTGGSLAEVADLRHDPRTPCVLVKPMTYMNRSGEPLARVLREMELPVEALMVVVDDFAIELGRLRLRAAGSDGGHNGLRSVAAQLKGPGYARLRVGIGPCPERMPSEAFVLQRFKPGERHEVEEAVARAANAAEDWARGLPLDGLMNTYNAKVKE